MLTSGLAWLSHILTHNSCGCLHMIKTVKIPVCMGEGSSKLHPWKRSYWQLLDDEGGTITLIWGHGLMVGCTGPSGWLHTHVGSIN